jgi:nucleoside-diphosphate-sugar epimerase
MNKEEQNLNNADNPKLGISDVSSCINCLHRAIEKKDNKTIHYCTGRTYTTTIQDPESYVCHKHFKI